MSVLALAAGAAVETACANQFFVCEDGRTVAVARGELEQAKRENACVARHFEPAADVAKAGKPSLKSAVAEPGINRPAAVASASIALPVRKPQRPKLRMTNAAPSPQRDSTAPHRIAEAARTSYRRVRVINARSPAGQWFHHKR